MECFMDDCVCGSSVFASFHQSSASTNKQGQGCNEDDVLLEVNDTVAIFIQHFEQIVHFLLPFARTIIQGSLLEEKKIPTLKKSETL